MACAWSEPSHDLNQCCNIVDRTLRNKRQWNLNRNSHIFVQEMPLKKSFAKWRSFCLGPNLLGQKLLNPQYNSRDIIKDFVKLLNRNSWWYYDLEMLSKSDPSRGESPDDLPPGLRGNPFSQRVGIVERWCLCCYLEQTIEQTVELPVFRDPIAFISRQCIFFTSSQK